MQQLGDPDESDLVAVGVTSPAASTLATAGGATPPADLTADGDPSAGRARGDRPYWPRPVVRRSAAGDLSITTTAPRFDRREVLGLPLAACSTAEFVETVEAWVDEGWPRLAAGVNAHVVNLAARRAEVHSLFEQTDLNYADGQSVVWAAGMLGLDVPERVATTDLVYPLMEMCARRGFGVYLLGGRRKVVERAAARLQERYPGLRVTTHHGYLSPTDDAEVVASINRSGASILLVGMGDPVQQRWARDHLGLVATTVVLTCGGLFDWVSGANPRPPEWMVRAGLEWLWRVIIEPRRLLRRYLVGNPEFLARLAVATLRRRLSPTRRLAPKA